MSKLLEQVCLGARPAEIKLARLALPPLMVFVSKYSGDICGF
jgi:hypothetical protein